MLTQLQRLKMLKPPKEPIDMVLDTDTYNEIDDQYAMFPGLRRVWSAVTRRFITSLI